MIEFKALTEIIKILYVEDEEITRTITQKLLKKHTKNIYVAKNGKEGLELFKNCKPDIVITDIRMPILNGIDMIKEIRKFDQDCGIIITTEYNDVNLILESVDIGIDKYEIKPINEEKINDAIKTVLGKISKRRTYDKLFNNLFNLNKDDKKRIEEEIKSEVSIFLKKALGKGPRYVKTIINHDTIEVLAHEVLTSMEKTLIEDANNINIIEYNRRLFYECKKMELEHVISKIVNKDAKIENVYMNIIEDEDIIVFRC